MITVRVEGKRIFALMNSNNVTVDTEKKSVTLYSLDGNEVDFTIGKDGVTCIRIYYNNTLQDTLG